jgi:hypothetical protein
MRSLFKNPHLWDGLDNGERTRARGPIRLRIDQRLRIPKDADQCSELQP